MKTLLCADFEFYDAIYSKIPERNPDIQMDYVVDGEEALKKLSEKKYDYLITTIVMPKKNGIEVIDEIKKDSSKYGNPKIAILTGLTGDLVMEQVNKRCSAYIYRNDKTIDEIQEEITKFLNEVYI